MRIGTILAAVLFAVASLFFVYFMVITPSMDMGLPEQGYRRPIQDQPAHPDTQKKPPLVDSNVPPASGSARD